MMRLKQFFAFLIFSAILSAASAAELMVAVAANFAAPMKIISQQFERETGHTLKMSFGGTGQVWSKKADLIDDKGEILKTGKFDKLALANPKLAPYGAAAMQILEKMNLTKQLGPKLVEASNIGQAFQFVSSGNAALGFVALSQVFENGKLKEGSGWVVPANLYSPIKQDAVLLTSGKANVAAQALLQYLRSDKVKAIIVSFGYDL